MWVGGLKRTSIFSIHLCASPDGVYIINIYVAYMCAHQCDITRPAWCLRHQSWSCFGSGSTWPRPYKNMCYMRAKKRKRRDSRLRSQSSIYLWRLIHGLCTVLSIHYLFIFKISNIRFQMAWWNMKVYGCGIFGYKKMIFLRNSDCTYIEYHTCEWVNK